MPWNEFILLHIYSSVSTNAWHQNIIAFNSKPLDAWHRIYDRADSTDRANVVFTNMYLRRLQADLVALTRDQLDTYVELTLATAPYFNLTLVHTRLCIKNKPNQIHTDSLQHQHVQPDILSECLL